MKEKLAVWNKKNIIKWNLFYSNLQTYDSKYQRLISESKI